MTGDVSRRKQALSVFLSTLMVLSVLAMGMAGFAGSAAASPPDDGNFDGFVASNPTTDNQNADFTVTVNITDTGVTNTDLASSGDGDSTINITFPSGVDASAGSLDGDESAVSVDLVNQDGTVQSELSVTDGDGVVTVDQGGNRVNVTVDSASVSADEGDMLRVVLGGQHIDYSSVDTSNSPYTVNTEVFDDEGDSQSEDISWILPGPIEHSDRSSNFYSLQMAIDQIDSDGEYVNATGDISSFNNDVGYEFDEFDEFLTQSSGLSGNAYGVSSASVSNNADIVADGDVPIVTSDVGSSNTGDEFVTVSGGANVRFDGLDVSGSGFLSPSTPTTPRANQFIDTDATNAEITVQNSNFKSFDETVISVSDNADRVVVENTDFDGETSDDYEGVIITDTSGNVDIGTSGAGNTFTNVSGGTGVSVTTGSNADLVNITDNTIGIDDGTGISIDTSNQDSGIDISGNDIVSDTSNGNGITITGDGSDTDASVDISGGTIDNVTDAVDASEGGLQFDGSYLNVTGVEMTNLQGASSNGVAVVEGTDGQLDIVVVDDISVEGDSQTTGVNADAQANVDILNSAINNTDIGVNADDAASYFNVSNTEVTNSGTTAIDVEDLGAAVKIDSGTSIDQAPTGIDVAGGSGTTYDISGITVNGTTNTGAADGGAGLFVESLSNSNDAVNVTDSTFTSNEEALNVSDGALSASPTEQVNIHFNTFEDNVYGVGVGDIDDGDVVINATFNDFVDNTEGLNVTSQSSDDNVNANYNWWGDATGPGGVVDNNSVVDSSGTVVPKESSDVTFTPWLSESTDTLDQTSQSLLVIPDASNPYAQSNNADVASADNQLENATVGVVVLDDGTASGENGISSINLIDSNVDDAEISQGSLQGSDVSKSAGVTQNISANVTGDVEFRAVGDNNAGPNEFTQTFSNDIDSVEVELNRSTLPAGETARATMTLYDSNGEVIENTGTPVGFSFSPSDEISVSAEDEITRGGTASAEFTTTTPGQNISVQAFENKNGESATVSLGTATGAVSASESDFNFKGTTVDGSSEDLTGGNAVNAGTEHDLSAVIRDSSGNALEGVEVEFNQNTTAEFDDEMPLETDANGVVNTTVTLPEDAGVTTEISIAADDFNPDQTTDANVNVTTQAAAADSLSFANDNIVVPSGQTSEVTVEIVDEFGNHADEIDSGEIALSSDDADTISVESSPVSVDADGNATFTLNATAQSGSVNLTATRSGVDDATTTATIGEPQGIQITVDNSSIASGVDNATDVTDVTAQFVDANGDAIGVGSSEIRFTREDGDAAKVNSSAAIDSDPSGAATFEAIATSQTGDTTFELSSPEFDVSNTTTITTTGAPDTIGFSPNVSSPAVNDTVDVTVTVEDSQNRVVPVTAQNYFDMSVQSDAGSFVESDTVRDASDGEGSINVTSSEGGDVTVDAFISAEALNDDTTITFTDQSANYTLELVDGPTTITQNESYSATLQVTNEGEVAGNQTVSYVLEDESGAATAIDVEKTGVELDAGNSTELTFNAPADATAGLTTGNYTHVFSSEDDELTVDAEVVEEGAAPAIVGDTPATDTDGDGVYEDVNGDGELDIVDVNAFFQNYEGQQVQDNADLFDFNDDGEISIVDVNRLFQDSQA